MRRGAVAGRPLPEFVYSHEQQVAVDGAGRPLLCLSDLAEHSRNLAADPRASLMASDSGTGDPLALARVTVLGSVVELRGADRGAALRATPTRSTRPSGTSGSTGSTSPPCATSAGSAG